MNARYPASSTGMWGQVKRTHIVAAIAATIGVMVGAAAVAAWDATDDSDSRGRVSAPPPINIDRLAEAAARQDPQVAPAVTGETALFGPEFVDAASLEAAIAQHENALAANAITGAGETGEIPAFGPEFVDVASLEAAIAQHENSLAGSGVVDDTGEGTSGEANPGSRHGGVVFPE